MRLIRERDWKYVEIEGGDPLLFDTANDPEENVNLADPARARWAVPEYAQEALFRNFS